MKNDKVSDIQFKSNDNFPSYNDTNSQTIIECDVNEKIDTNQCNNRLSTWDAASVTPSTENSINPEPEIKPLTDININLHDIKPGNIFFLFVSILYCIVFIYL